MDNNAVIILSGGMDSVTTLAVAKDKGFTCYTLSFNYGQKSISELNAASYYSKKYNCVEHKVFDINFKNFTDSALTNNSSSVIEDSKENIPNTYVPILVITMKLSLEHLIFLLVRMLLIIQGTLTAEKIFLILLKK